MVARRLFLFVISLFICSQTFGQHSDESSRIKQLNIYQDSLASLGKNSE